MPTPPVADTVVALFAQLLCSIDPFWRLRNLEILSGGNAANVTRLDIETRDGQQERLVVRRHRPRDLAANADIAADEFKLLELLAVEGIAAPLPIHREPAGIFEAPCLVVSHIDGTTAENHPDPDALVVAMADWLAKLHRIDGSRRELAFLPRAERWLDDALAQRPATPDDTLSEMRIRDALASLRPPAPRNRPALLHGDFWPGNILWRDGAIAGVIDWEDAAIGDPVAELANARFELDWLTGPDYATRFIERYVEATGGAIDLADLPRWDLAAALRPAFWVGGWEDYDPDTVRTMKSRHRAFVDRALTALGGRYR